MRLGKAGRCWLAAMGIGWALPSGAVVTVGPWQEHAESRADAPGPQRRQRFARFALGPVTYNLSYTAWLKPDDPTFCKVGEGPTGMPEPTSEGWYHGGFINVSLDGRRLDQVPLSSFELVEHGDRGVVDLVWHDPRADLRYRVIGRDGEDHLLLEVTIEPQAAVKSWQVELVAYPSYFTSWNKRVGARRIWTPGGTLAQGQRLTRTPHDGRAALLYDEVFDPAKGEGRGPCGLAVAESGLDSIEFQTTDYPCWVRLRPKPESRTVRLALWKFPDQANAPLLASFPAKSETALAELAATDFTPAAFKSFDPAEMTRLLAAARARPAAVKALGPKLDRLAAWLEACHPPAPGQPLSIAGAETFLAGVREQEDFIWEIRLNQLLDF